MAALALDKNQGNVYREGCWLWRKSVTLDNTDALRHAMFELPENTRVLDAILEVETASTGTTVAGTVSIENDGGDVDIMGASVDLKVAAKTLMDAADRGVEVVAASSANKVDVVIDIASTAPGATDPVVTLGIFVARLDYTHD